MKKETLTAINDISNDEQKTASDPQLEIIPEVAGEIKKARHSRHVATAVRHLQTERQKEIEKRDKLNAVIFDLEQALYALGVEQEEDDE
jgi:hypothetical protein